MMADQNLENPPVDPDQGPSKDVVTKELAAMSNIVDELSNLPSDSQKRVLSYVLSVTAVGKLVVGADLNVGYAIKSGRSAYGAVDETRMLEDSSQKRFEPPKDLAELFSLAEPSTDYEKALVVAYFRSQINGEDEFDSFTINSALTHLGHRVGNITRALDNLVAQRPAPVVQTRKEGKSKQARKKFKLTVEGRRRVEEMLAQRL